MRKTISKKREEEKPASPPATSPPATTVPNSPKSAPAALLPPSHRPKCVSLFDWWLIKANDDTDGKRLAVGGLTSQGKLASRVFTSAPIVTRHDAFTFETADGFTVRIQGMVNQARSMENGVPAEVCRYFMVGFPLNWEYYADGKFWNEPTSSFSTSSQAEHSSDSAGSVFPIHIDEFPMAKILDVFRSNPDTPLDDLLINNLTSTPGKVIDDTSSQSCQRLTRNAARKRPHTPPKKAYRAPLTRAMAKELSIRSPELLDLKRSKSGRLLVPPIARWCHQEVIYEMDGSIAGITGMDVSKSPRIGTVSAPAKQKKGKLRQ